MSKEEDECKEAEYDATLIETENLECYLVIPSETFKCKILKVIRYMPPSHKTAPGHIHTIARQGKIFIELIVLGEDADIE